jgi:hypothetical protein
MWMLAVVGTLTMGMSRIRRRRRRMATRRSKGTGYLVPEGVRLSTVFDVDLFAQLEQEAQKRRLTVPAALRHMLKIGLLVSDMAQNPSVDFLTRTSDGKETLIKFVV